MTRGTRSICQLSDRKRVFMKCLHSCEIIRLDKSAVRSPWSAEPRPALAGKWRLSGSLTWAAFARFGSIPAAGFNDRFPRSTRKRPAAVFAENITNLAIFPVPVRVPITINPFQRRSAAIACLATPPLTLRHASRLSRTCTLCTDVGSGARSDRTANPTPWQAPPNELYNA
jgi:hypothetical protein